jgi:hypothetical protein
MQGETFAYSGDQGETHDARCRLCGGEVKRTWGDVCILNIATFFVFTMLTPFLFMVAMHVPSTPLRMLILPWAGIALISLLALPLTAALAVAGRAQCRRCGEPLPSLSGEGGFPVWSGVLGGVLLLIALVTGLTWFRSAPGQETGAVGLRLLLRVIMAVLALGLGLLAQAIIWRKRRMRTAGGARRELLLLLPAVLLGTGWLALTGHDHRVLTHRYDPVRRAPAVLDRAGLAALPASAREVKVHAWAFLMSGKYTLRFAAEPNDIERFLAESPSLKGRQCQTYSRDRMRLRARNLEQRLSRPRADGHEYYEPWMGVPGWYKREIQGPGRRYEVNWYDGKYQGELIVDDEDHVVYVHVSR